MKKADLHLHTNFSDGSFTPQELVVRAHQAGLACIAVTDHDCVDAVVPAIRAAGDSLEVIAGVELTAEQETKEFHILGYFIDITCQELNEELHRIRVRRKNRVYDIIEKLSQHGVRLDADDVFHIAGEGSMSRLHIAQAMVAKGLVATIGEAFGRYLGNDACAYVGKFTLTAEGAIKMIIRSGGIAVLAHPYILRCDELIPSFVDAGLRGLEVFYPEHSASVREHYLQLAKKHTLLVTGGSDCHGIIKHGVGIGSVSIDYALVERMKKEKYG